MLYNVYDNLVKCPTQPTCIAHFVLCISQIHNEKYERNTAGQLARIYPDALKPKLPKSDFVIQSSRSFIFHAGGTLSVGLDTKFKNT